MRTRRNYLRGVDTERRDAVLRECGSVRNIIRQAAAHHGRFRNLVEVEAGICAGDPCTAIEGTLQTRDHRFILGHGAKLRQVTFHDFEPPVRDLDPSTFEYAKTTPTPSACLERSGSIYDHGSRLQESRDESQETGGTRGREHHVPTGGPHVVPCSRHRRSIRLRWVPSVGRTSAHSPGVPQLLARRKENICADG